MRKRHRYVTVIVNADTAKTLAMVPHRSSAALSAFLMQQGHRWCKGVKVVVSDGSRRHLVAPGDGPGVKGVKVVVSDGRPSGRYMPRIVDAQVQAGLRALPAVVLVGPRACGKTSTGREHARSEVMFGSSPSARLAAQVDPAGLLAGPEPRLLDEWQLAPEIWSQVRAAGDDGRRPGRFILTGSASPSDDVTRHTGTGRITRVQMRPMSLFETGLSSGEVSMGDLFSGGKTAVDHAAKSLLKLRDTVEDRHVGAPANLAVVTAAGYGYRRNDGVLVAPLTALGPP